MITYDPRKVNARMLRKHERFSLLYNNNTELLHLIEDLAESLSGYKRGKPVEKDGQIYVPFEFTGEQNENL